MQRWILSNVYRAASLFMGRNWTALDFGHLTEYSHGPKVRSMVEPHEPIGVFWSSLWVSDSETGLKSKLSDDKHAKNIQKMSKVNKNRWFEHFRSKTQRAAIVSNFFWLKRIKNLRTERTNAMKRVSIIDEKQYAQWYFKYIGSLSKERTRRRIGRKLCSKCKRLDCSDPELRIVGREDCKQREALETTRIPGELEANWKRWETNCKLINYGV